MWDAKRNEHMRESRKAYTIAHELAIDNLSPVHPIRLGVALNMSVFYYEILDEPEEACTIAKRAFDDVIRCYDTDWDDYRDTPVIMQLLRDNLTVWTASFDDNSLEKG